MTFFKKKTKHFPVNFINTGSSIFQIILFTSKIFHISYHLKSNRKDIDALNSLLNLVVKRKRMLLYLKRSNFQQYSFFIKKLHLHI